MADEKKIENEVKEVKEEKPRKTKEENKKLIAYKKALDEIDKKWKKKLGTKDTVAGLLPEMNADVERFSSGSVVIDNIIGGGFPRGRIIEIFGPEACLFEDTFIPYETIEKKSGKRINHKGGTIKKLYERFHGIKNDGRSFMSKYKPEDLKYNVSSINENDCVFMNEILDVVKSGIKECFEVTAVIGEKEYKIEATKDHKFYVGNNKYEPLENLKVGDSIFIHDSFRNTQVDEKDLKEYRVKEVYTKNYPNPNCPIKMVEGKYKYYRNPIYRVVVDAYLNDLEFDDFVEILNNRTKEEIEELKFVDSTKFDIHHIDGNRQNNTIENLEIIERREHYRQHAHENQDNLRFIAKPAKIVGIENKGMKETYDIRCFSPYNNYVANNFVVHNSGKTSIALTAVGNVQKQGGNCFFIDVEQALDPVYARKLGVNLDELGFAQPSIAEEALQLMADLIVTDQIDLIVLDSVAALMPKAQYEEEVGKQTMALLARIMSQSLPKFTKLCREHDCSVIFINQVRDNVGVMFGAKTTTPGGKALKFYASQRLDIRRVKTIKDGEDSIGTEVKVKCVKNKVSVPYGEGTTVLTFAQGINRVEELLIVGQELGVIEQKGQTFYLHTDEELDQEEYPLSDDGYKIAVYQKGLRERLTDDKVIFDEVSKLVAKKLKEEIENR